VELGFQVEHTLDLIFTIQFQLRLVRTRSSRSTTVLLRRAPSPLRVRPDVPAPWQHLRLRSVEALVPARHGQLVPRRGVPGSTSDRAQTPALGTGKRGVGGMMFSFGDDGSTARHFPAPLTAFFLSKKDEERRNGRGGATESGSAVNTCEPIGLELGRKPVTGRTVRPYMGQTKKRA
jgi:hypothetical protein